MYAQLASGGGSMYGQGQGNNAYGGGAGGMWGGVGGATAAPAPTPHLGQPPSQPQPYGDPMAQFGQIQNLVTNPMFSSMAANYADWDTKKQQACI